MEGDLPDHDEVSVLHDKRIARGFRDVVFQDVVFDDDSSVTPY